jgi:hypothetical protein
MIKVKFDDGSEASFTNQDNNRFKSYPVNKRVKAVFNDGEPGGAKVLTIDTLSVWKRIYLWPALNKSRIKLDNGG